ncbi:MAG: Gfo/Idh/MocA family oxidoreductase [Lentisphaeria bacterium]|nr:Gfo/Idh/MocA family oxidoreductase [Lentisphaeria bacterium]
MAATAKTAALFGEHRKLKKGEKLTFAMIGMGIQGRDVLRDFIKNDKLNIVAVCDVDKERVAEAKRMVDEHYGNTKCKTTGDFRDIINDPKIDVVGIATPDHWHAYIAVEAMKHGKDVFCEKPLTYSIDEAKKVMKAQTKYNRVFQVDAWQRSWDIFRTAVMLVRNEVFGKIRYVDTNYGYGGGAKLGGPSHPLRFFDEAKNAATEGAPNPNVDWDMWLGPAKVRPYSDQLAPRGINTFYPMFWRFDDDLATGYNGDWGAHHLDIAQWGMDMDNSGPYKIIRSTEPYSKNPLHGGRRQYGMKMLFKKKYGDIELYHGPFGVWGTVFYCDNGIVAVNRGKLAVWGDTGLVKPNKKIRKAIDEATFMPDKIVAASVGADYGFDINIKADERLANTVKVLNEKFDLAHAKVQVFQPKEGHVGDFVNSCYDRTATISPAAVGGRTAILCGLCNMSYVYDTGFDWDPVKNDFANGTGQGISLKRDSYRNGWDVIV